MDLLLYIVYLFLNALDHQLVYSSYEISQMQLI